MKEKKNTQIATNVSSGAEKVEIVEEKVKESKKAPQKVAKKRVVSEKTAQKGGLEKSADRRVRETEKKIDVKEMNARSTNGKAEAESIAAKARVEAALKKKEAQAKKAEEREKLRKARKAERAKRIEARLAAKKALAEKRAAEKKAIIEKRAAEKKAKAEKRAAQKEAQTRERAHGKAKRSRERERERAKRREKNRSNGGNERKRRDNYGGWLAAVITLGATTLALTTAVTIGAIDMKETKDSAMAGYRSTTYELVGIMENVDNDLDRARISASPVQQARILTDLLVQARLAELDLEKMPISAEMNSNLTSFINRVGMESERMLSKLRRGEALSEQDEATLQKLYEKNHEVRAYLSEFMGKMDDSMLMDYIKKGEGMFKKVLEDLEQMTLEENRLPKGIEKPQMEGAGKGRNAMEGANESDGGSPKMESARAEELCREYFADYKIQEFQCIGETVTRDYVAYNVQGYDEKGTLLFAEVDLNSGELVRFNYYEECNEDTFDLENSKRIAEQFLEKLGYEDLSAMRVGENGTDANFTFVYEKDGVAYYPDEIKVKVCRTRGLVTGFDAGKYLKNHKVRPEMEVKLNLEQAQAKLHKGMEVESSRLAVVRAGKNERSAYEFVCSYMGEKYLIYTDAVSGEEIAIVNVKNLG